MPSFRVKLRLPQLAHAESKNTVTHILIFGKTHSLLTDQGLRSPGCVTARTTAEDKTPYDKLSLAAS